MKRALGIFAAILISAGAAVAVGEVALRAMGYSSPIFYEPDAELGWKMRPGAKGWFTFEGRGFVQVSPAGFRDRTHDLNKPRNTYRVAVLGDSFAEAMQVDFKSTFWWQLQEKLGECAPQGTQVEVMNFGVSGYGTVQESIQLEKTAIKYQPDFVLLAFTNGNDLLNNSPRLESDKERPFYRLDANKRLRLDASFAEGAEFRRRTEPWLEYYRAASDKLRVVQVAHQAKKAFAAIKAGTAQAQEPAAKRIPGIEPGTDVSAFAPPRDAAWEETWAVTELVIAGMSEFAARNGARFALTIVPFAAQVHPDATLRRNLQNALGVEDLFYIERRMEALGRKGGFPVIPLAYDMQRRADSDKVYLHGFRNIGMGIGHWNEEGHRMAADILAKRLCTEAFKRPL